MNGRTRMFIAVALLSGGALLAAGPAVAQTAAPPICLYAFSKNLCSASLSGGTWGIPICTTGGTGCSNLQGHDATFSGPVTSHGGRCGEDLSSLAPCDEAPDFLGQLVAEVDVRTQRHTPCKARGSWEGPFRLVDPAGVAFASGNLVATMGMGTHRKTDCPLTAADCGRDCETCHDARVVSHAFDWQIGTEGTLKGRVQSGRYAGCTFTASFQGDFTANGDSRGPQTPNLAWRYCGTLEGVLECPCPP